MGLKQCDPLAPFLFLLVAKGPSGLISIAVELHLLSGIRVGSSDLIIYHLQYADNTIILVDATIDNLWTIKAFLRGFELALDLQVIFANSYLIRVNSDQAF